MYMDSRPLINKNSEKLCVFLDSNCFDGLLSNSEKDAETILKYRFSEPFEFIKSPIATDKEELKEVIQYNKKIENDNMMTIEVTRGDTQSTMSGYSVKSIMEITKVIFNKENPNDEEVNTVTLIFVQATLKERNMQNIFVTDNDILLKNRLWFESHFPGCPLNIVTLNEAMEIMGLFSRYWGKFHILGNYFCNKGYWYWLLFRTKVPYFHVGDKILDAFSSRFVFLLTALDEMGFQYYHGVNNDTMKNTLYHFNYFISLISGIFDSLAIRTKSQYTLKFNGEHIPSRTSLSKDSGKEFLKEIKKANLDLYNHIINYTNFIKLIYQLRELVLHREGLLKSGFEYKDKDKKWKANFIKITKLELQYIKGLNNVDEKYQNTTSWGVYELQDNLFLDPYIFSKKATSTLIEFSNKYLQLLNFNNFIQDLISKDLYNSFCKNCEIFNKGYLGTLPHQTLFTPPSPPPTHSFSHQAPTLHKSPQSAPQP